MRLEEENFSTVSMPALVDWKKRSRSDVLPDLKPRFAIASSDRGPRLRNRGPGFLASPSVVDGPGE